MEAPSSETSHVRRILPAGLVCCAATVAVHTVLEDLVVVGSNVRARAKPSPDAPVVATLRFAVLARAKDPYDSDSDDGWEEVMVEGARRAFISSRFVRSPIDYRAGFVKKGGRWLMSAFIAGD